MQTEWTYTARAPSRELTLAEASTRDAKEQVNAADLDLWIVNTKQKVLDLIRAEFDATPFPWIGDLDFKCMSGHLDDAFGDALGDLARELD